MIIQKNLDPETQKIIARLIEMGKYKDYHEFVSIAIANQIQLDSNYEIECESEVLESSMEDSGKVASTVSDGLAERAASQTNFPSPLPRTEPLAKPKSLDFFSTAIPDWLPVKPELETDKDIQFEAYGPGSSGLIWIFHNRFFPVKVTLRVLAHLIESENTDSIEFDYWKSSSSDYGMELSNFIQGSDRSKQLRIGLPASINRLNGRFTDKRNRNSIVQQKVESTKKRFSEQFVGRLLKDEAAGISSAYCGACFEMGLVTNGAGEQRSMIYLTENGRRFLEMRNPVFDSIRSKTINSMSTFSDVEIDFIRDSILPRFKLENKIIGDFLKSAGEARDGIGKEKFSETFKKSKRQYNAGLCSNSKVHERVKESYMNSKEHAKQEFKENEMIDWVVGRIDETETTFGVQQNSTIGRLVEMGLITKESRNGKIFYFIKK